MVGYVGFRFNLGRLLYQKQLIMFFKCLREMEWTMSRECLGSDFPRQLRPIRNILAAAWNALKDCPVGTTSHTYAKKLKEVLEELRKIFLYRCREGKPMDRTLAAQLYNMLTIMSSVKPMSVPNPPIRYDDYDIYLY